MKRHALQRIGIVSSISKLKPPAWSIPTGVAPAAGKIAVTIGTGYAGSTYRANMAGGGQWWADSTPIPGATAITYIMTVENEGKVITYRQGANISNSIQMWLYPQLGSTLKCWYDASLTSSFTYQSGTNISSWANRVSGAVPATQNTANKYPQFTTNGLQNGYNAVVANGTFQQFSMASGFALGDQTAFAVMKTSDTRTATNASWWGSPGIWGNEVSGFPADFGWVLQAGQPTYGASNSKHFSATAVANGLPMMLSYTRSTTTGLVSHYLNGSFLDSGSTVTGNRTIGNGTTSMFNSNSLNTQASGATTYLGAAISEFIIIDTILTDINRQQLEGCAAWRWGLQSRLPADHPYKNGAPGFISA